MIKKLSLKFVLVSLVLVVSVIITSSCYASEKYTLGDFNITLDKELKTITFVNNKYNTTHVVDISAGLAAYSDYYLTLYPNPSNNNVYIGLYFSDSFKWKLRTDIPTYLYIYGSANSYAYTIDYKVDSSGVVSFTFPYGDSSGYQEGSSWYMRGWNQLNLTHDTQALFYSTQMMFASHTITTPNGTVLYEPAPDTSFDYSFEGVKRGQVKLEISNLNESLRMYGYVDLDTTFSIGDTLDITSNTANLRLLASKSDNSDLNCYLNEGEELNYYIVDENNIILDTGYISEMAKGYFLYGFNVNNGVDFVFLKDGQVYWSNDLDFTYKFNNSEVFEDDDIVSMAQSSYIVSDKTVANINYIGYVYDSNNNLLCEATCNFLNDLSSISISVDTTYTEQNIGWNKSCYWLMSINLDGTNIDGTSIDFSNYYVKWSVPTWLNLDSIEYNGEEYTKRNGIINGFSSNGLSGMFNLKIYELIKNHIKAFDIKLEVYDSDDNLVLTHIINSDDIIRDKVVSDENNVDKDDYDILDNPNYTGGSSTTPDINNIQNWTSDDYLNLMSTDNFVWEFFKAILGNLPWWITVPLTILIFGVVIITLIRFARGA